VTSEVERKTVTRPDVVVIGGGAVGLAASIELAAHGLAVTLIERRLLGAADSTMTGGGIRQQFGTATNVRLAQLSAPGWEGFESRFGIDIRFRRIGYLFLGKTPEAVAVIADHVELQHGLGVDSELLGDTEIAARWPSLAGRGFLAAGFRAADGWANHFRIVHGYVQGAIAAGVQLEVGTEVLSIDPSQGDGVVVRTNAGDVAAGSALLTPGAWARTLLLPLDIDLPVIGRRHELIVVDLAEPLDPALPWLIGVEDEVHLRPDAPGQAQIGGFLGHDDEVDPDTYPTRADPAWTANVLAASRRVFGIAEGAVIGHGWAGLYPGTPDRHPIIDRVAPNVFVSVGFAGTGLMMAPGAAIVARELIVDGEIRSIDGAPLRADRFGAHDPGAEVTGF
jgi:glycine/D-amino acid oxidase-like deaminating enzyme